MEKEITRLFKTRDNAIETNNKEHFLTTQINGKGIENSVSAGYLELSKLTSTVLQIHQEEKSKNLWITFVKEEYYKNRKFTHSGYLLYYVTRNPLKASHPALKSGA